MSLVNTRWVRLLGTVVFMIAALLSKTSRNVYFIAIFLLLIFSDLFLLNYENTGFKTLQFLFRGFAYLLIGVEAKKSIQKYEFSGFQFVILSFVFIINLFLLYTVAETFHSELKNTLVSLLFYFQGVNGIIMLMLAAVYLSENGSFKSTAYFLMACGFILTDLAAFAAYHLQFLELFIIDRMFYLLALGGLLKYISLKDEAEF
ncbi:MAG: hypothetical protein R3214_10105 [Christiangramia sp.]|nr:hypothetical protein [Christiangramia sp.]